MHIRNENRPRPTRNGMFWSLLAICAGTLFLWKYTQPHENQGLLAKALKYCSQLLGRHMYDHNPQVFDLMASHYVRVPILLLPAWILFALGLVVLARMVWRPVFTSLISRYATWIAVVVALAAVLCSYMISTRVLERESITSGDEYCYAFQAKLFASGRLYGSEGAGMEEFVNRAIVTKGPRRYAIGFPGHPLILSLGLLMGNVHVVPAVMAGISVFLLYLIARAIVSKCTALIAVILMASSPFYLAFHATLLPQSSLIPCLLLFLLSTVNIVRHWKWHWLLIGAVALTLAMIIRPPSVMLFAAPATVYLLLQRSLSLRRRLVVGIICLLAVLIGTATLCVFSAEVSGRPISLTLSPRPPGELLYSSGLGFGGPRGHTLIRGLLGTAKALLGWNYYLFGWPISFLPVVVWFFKRGKSGWEYTFIISAVCYYGFYLVYQSQSWQYYLDTIPLFALVSACAISGCHARSDQEPGDSHLEGTHRSAVCLPVSSESMMGDTRQIAGSKARGVPHLMHMLLIVGVALSLFFSWPSLLAYFRNRVAPRQNISEAIYEANVKNAIVLLDNNLPKEMYSAIGRNSPDLNDDVILARKLPGDKWHRTVALFPDRSAWIIRMDAENQLLCLPYRQDDRLETETDQENGGAAKEKSRRVESHRLFQD